MSAVLTNPIPNPVVRILTHECEKPYNDHQRCPGVLRQPDITFVCTCECHRRLPLFDGASA